MRITWQLWKTCRLAVLAARCGAMLAAAALVTGVAASVAPCWGQGLDYELVAVRDAGNANDVTGYGGVSYDFRIGTYEVTIGQYAAFLNAVAKADPNNLYSTAMATNQTIAGISRTGSSGSYAYGVTGPFGATQIPQATAANRPITYVCWFDAARFANWMSNGQPTGLQGPATTENGAYDLSDWLSDLALPMNPINPNTGSVPLYRIPTENEWYKAAYYRGGGAHAGYWTYATRSDAAPGNVPGGAANEANYYAGVHTVTQSATFVQGQNYLTDIGSFTASPSGYGTFDQSGNVWEWNDLAGASGAFRGLRGGGCDDEVSGLASSNRDIHDPASESGFYGFRLASPVAVPEPSTCAALAAGFAFGCWHVLRRRETRA